MNPFRSLATLAILVGVAALALRVLPPGGGHGSELAMLLGFLLLAADVAGSAAVEVGLPRITGYILVGIAAGPHALGILSPDAIESLRLIDEFALALIAMLAGGELKLDEVRRDARTITLATVAVTTVVWVGVGVTLVLLRPLLPFLHDVPLPVLLGSGALIGIWAANSSPDATVAVIGETGARGRLTEIVLGVTIVKDVLVIVCFTLTLSLVAGVVGSGQGGMGEVLLRLLQEVGGAFLVGGLMGWGFSRYLERIGRRVAVATLVFAYLIVILAPALHVELLLTAVAAGFVIENLSPAGDRLIQGIETNAIVVFAVFFALAGAALDLGALGEFWLAAAILFASRIFFTWAGARAGLAVADEEPRIRSGVWKGIVSQAGVTLGLLVVLERQLGEAGSGLVALGTAVIIGNILVGPVLLKRALTAAGETRSGRQGPSEEMDELREIVAEEA